MKHFFRLCLLLFLPMTLWAESRIADTRIYEKGNTLYVDVNSVIELPENIQQAIDSGLILFFEYDFEIKKQQWFHFKALAQLKKQYILSYQQMTGEYQIENPITYQIISFKSLNAAVQFMQRLRQFPLVSVGQLTNDNFVLRARFRLSAENLPTIVKLERLFSDRWKADSKWTIWLIP